MFHVLPGTVLYLRHFSLTCAYLFEITEFGSPTVPARHYWRLSVSSILHLLPIAGYKCEIVKVVNWPTGSFVFQIKVM